MNSVRISSAPHRAVQGDTVRLAVAVRPAGVRCRLSVRYEGGALQPGLRPVRALRGRAEWKWQLARDTSVGAARATVSCGSAGSAARSILIVGSVIPANIRVANQGFSVRQYNYGGSSVSWGVILANESPNRDAVEVTVLANFVMADNRLIGSATTRISAISAGTQHAVGGELSFLGGAPIERLEIVVQTRKSGPPTRRKPAVTNLRVVPGLTDPFWAGSLEGELINDDGSKLSRAQLGAVIFDADGKVIGGGSGFAYASLPPGAREFIKITTGMRAIAMNRAASALVSVVPTYE